MTDLAARATPVVPEDEPPAHEAVHLDNAANDPEFAAPDDDPRLEQAKLFRAHELPDIFNDTASPPGVELSHDRRATMTQWNNAYGDLTIGSPGGGSFLGQDRDFYGDMHDYDEADQDPRGRKNKGAKEFKDLIRDIEKLRTLQEHQAHWDKQIMMIGGKQMTGAEVHERSQYVLDKRNHEKIENDLVAQGMTREQARKRREEMEELARIKEKERNNEPLSPAEMRRRDELQNGPAGHTFTEIEVLNKKEGMQLSSRAYINSGGHAGTVKSIASGAEEINFASATNRDVQDLQRERAIEIARRVRSGDVGPGNGDGIMVASSRPSISQPAAPATISAPVKLSGEYNQASSGVEPLAAPVVAAAEVPKVIPNATKVAALPENLL